MFYKSGRTLHARAEHNVEYHVSWRKHIELTNLHIERCINNLKPRVVINKYISH